MKRPSLPCYSPPIHHYTVNGTWYRARVRTFYSACGRVLL